MVKVVDKAPCHTCKLKKTCDILKIYQVVVYECICLEFSLDKETQNGRTQ